MKKDGQGYFDWLVEDMVNTIEIKNAVEASRDENGKVDRAFHGSRSYFRRRDGNA